MGDVQYIKSESNCENCQSITAFFFFFHALLHFKQSILQPPFLCPLITTHYSNSTCPLLCSSFTSHLEIEWVLPY